MKWKMWRPATKKIRPIKAYCVWDELETYSCERDFKTVCGPGPESRPGSWVSPEMLDNGSHGLAEGAVAGA